jgi:hypothetical protein
MANENPAAVWDDLELIEAAKQLIIDLAKDRSKWRMCIPPQKDDSDELLMEVVDRFEKLVKSREV